MFANGDQYALKLMIDVGVIMATVSIIKEGERKRTKVTERASIYSERIGQLLIKVGTRNRCN